ncbi:MAG: cadherin-like beta sandwich domain-containing protein, partial [Candidatus Coproplasma sp.]
GYIANLKYKIGSSSAADVLTDSGIAFDSASNTYTLTKEYDPATYPAGTSFVLTGTASEGATITPTNITGSSGTWTKSLALGSNEFNLKANVDGVGSTTYKFVIKLVEKKNSITSMTLKQGTNVISGFSFNSSQTSYSLTVPYKNYDTINIEAVSDGVLTTLKAEISGATQTFAHTADTTSHTLNSVALTAGTANTIKVYGIADNGSGDKGTEYTIVITRGAADTNAKLQTLDVSVDGTPITEYDGGITFDPDTLTYTYTIPSTGNTTATIVLAATAQSDKATVTGTGTKTFTFGTTSKTETYTITVTPESGTADKKEYKVNIKRVVIAGDFTDVQISTDGSYYMSIFSGFDAAKSQTISYNVSTVPVGTSLSVKVTLNTPDAKVGSLTGLTQNAEVYVGNLSKFGLNTFKIAATSSLGSTTYTINVNLYEDKHDINNIEIIDSTNASLSDFTFNSWQDNYSIDLPFTTTYVTVKVTPDGNYNVICETGNKALTKNGTVYEKKVTLTAGSTTTLVVYGVANNGTGLSSDSTATGTKFTLNFNRAAADSSTTLSQLSVKINNVEKEYKDIIVFNPNVNDYVIEIEKEGTANTATVEFTAIPTVDTSTVKCDTVLMTTTTVTKTFTFQNNVEHETTYSFVVTAQSGVTNTYTVTIKRIIIAGDFTALEFAESGSTFEDVFTSSRYDEWEKTYTVDLSTDTVAEGSTVRIKATATSGATVTADGLTLSSSVWSGKLVHGKNEFSLTAKSATGQATYKFIVNLYENKKTIEKITLTSDGITLSTDLFSFNISQTTYRFTVPYTIKTLKMTVATDGIYTTVVDELNNAFLKTVSTGRNHERTIDLDEGRVTTLLIRGKSDKDEEGEWYTFEITRENANADASLKTLSVTVGGKLVSFTEGAFNPDITDYNILVDEASSYTVNISATPTASTSKVTGAGTKTFNLGDSTATQTYPITVTAEDGTERTYNITISQKPIVLDSNYDLTRIVINGSKDYYDDVPAYYNDPVKITVPYSESRVKVVVTAAVVKSQVVIDPALTKSGYLELPEGETVTLRIYAIAEDGSNSNGEEAYIFEITRLPQGEVIGPDTEIYIDDEEVTSFVLASDDTVLHVLNGYDYKKDKLKFQVDLVYGGTYIIKRISEDGTETLMVGETDTGKFKNVKLDFGTNVFSVDIVSSDGNSKKSAIFVVDRGEPTFEELSAPELPTLKNDFNKDPYSNSFSYSVGSDVDRVTLDVE